MIDRIIQKKKTTNKKMTRFATDVYITLNDGHHIPALGLGTVVTENPSQVAEQVYTAIKAGYRHIDTAWYYGTEKYVGEALRRVLGEGIVTREELFITTKVWHSFHHNPEKSLDTSLDDLGLEYVDLLLQHWPVCTHGDENGLPKEPFDDDGNLIYDDDPVNGVEFIKVYNDLERIKQYTNKVRSIGISNYSIPKLKKLLPNVKKYLPVINQIEYHPHLPQQDLVDFCNKNNIIVEAYSPVGGKGAPVVKDEYVIELAEKYHTTANIVLNAYQILNNRVTIPRSSNLNRIKDNVYLPALTQEELQNLYKLGENNPRRYTNDPWGYGIGFKWWAGDKLSKTFE